MQEKYYFRGYHLPSRVWRYQRGNQKPYIEEQTTHWSKEKVQKKIRQHNDEKDKQWSTKHTHKTTDRVTRTPLKPGMNLCAPEGLVSRVSVSADILEIFII